MNFAPYLFCGMIERNRVESLSHKVARRQSIRTTHHSPFTIPYSSSLATVRAMVMPSSRSLLRRLPRVIPRM